MARELSEKTEQETQEQVEARLKQEALNAGEFFEGDDSQEGSEGAAKPKGAEGEESGEDDQIDPDTLAAIAGDEKPRMVPHSRFNEVNEEAKAHRARVLQLEEELARMKGAAPAKNEQEIERPAAYNFDDAEERYTTAVLDGDTASARAIRAEIRREEQAAADARAEAAADRRYQANRKQDDDARNKLEFDLELNKAYAAHPFLNTEGAESNPEAIQETLVWFEHFSAKGKSPAQALSAAVGKVAPRYAKAEPDNAAEPPKPDIAQGLARAGRVPARPAGVGERARMIDVSKMSAKDIKGLSAEDEARLAGDMVG